MAIGSSHRPPPPNKVRWVDVEEEDVLGPRTIPPPIVLGPDGNGIKRLIAFRIDGHGRMIKTTTISRVRKLALQRRSWPKFGDAASQSNGILTMVSTEEILFQKPTAPGSTRKAKDVRVNGDPFIGLGKGGGSVLMVCRTCGRKGDHWTARCLYKDLGLLPEGLLINGPVTAEAPTAFDPDAKMKYMPPGLRGGAERRREETRYRTEKYSVKVSNLSEDTHEPDLFELFSVLGSIDHVHIPTYRNTSVSKGYGFVTFSNKEDAERAINKLDGIGYDNLIIRVEWAPWSLK
ncbi:uncharacterized protein LOC131252796 [Magnolia sinica]|uniref:uncharacterized protein LOC131252796 n=1 Tax=Magnolia sinica TaxID=86752 RepID=UPI0026596797|nr:uncharacterized protein LOC131252796 [Magnolia sinica]